MEELITVQVPEGSLILSPLSSEKENKKTFNGWLIDLKNKESKKLPSISKENVENNEVVKEVTDIFTSTGYVPSDFCLVGGAVIDLLEHRVPKDYDFIGLNLTDKHFRALVEAGYSFDFSTRTATTFSKGPIVLQFLKTSLLDFDFTIGQSTFSLKHKELKIDLISFHNKNLIPVNFESRRNALNSLIRIPHWKKKGYMIDDLTYLSLLGSVGAKTNINS